MGSVALSIPSAPPFSPWKAASHRVPSQQYRSCHCPCYQAQDHKYHQTPASSQGDWTHSWCLRKDESMTGFFFARHTNPRQTELSRRYSMVDSLLPEVRAHYARGFASQERIISLTKRGRLTPTRLCLEGQMSNRATRYSEETLEGLLALYEKNQEAVAWNFVVRESLKLDMMMTCHTSRKSLRIYGFAAHRFKAVEDNNEGWSRHDAWYKVLAT